MGSGDERGMVNDYLRFQNSGQEKAESAADVLDSVVRFVGVSPNSRKLNSHAPRWFASVGMASRISAG